ncbi:hypothetical protein C8R44DRAFT_835759 [Mycena epipterygia]|nr:hypothetical protein C8R44DRAFT_835759 [Mycena epipterygia]
MHERFNGDFWPSKHILYDFLNCPTNSTTPAVTRDNEPKFVFNIPPVMYYTTVPQPGLNDRNIGIPRGTPLDGMVYARGSAGDYNRYAAVTGDPGWSWDCLPPYFFKNEKWTEPADHHNTRGQFNPFVHSTIGINAVSLPASKELSDGWSFNLNFNSGNPLGLGWWQSTIGGGKRSSSTTSYPAPEFINRENLHVLLHAQVSKLVNSRNVDGKLVFGGVQFSQGGQLFTAKAAKEIILSAGSVGTPGILLHSGIGDKAALTALGINTLLDLPSVARNASDQVAIGAGWFVNSTQTLDSVTQNATRFNEAFAEWNRTHTGPFVMLGLTHIAWLRLDPQTLTANNFTDPSTGSDSPHIEVVFGVSASGHLTSGNGISTGIVALNPVSRGSVTINSSNPFDSPIIDVGFLQNDVDLFTLRQAVHKVLAFFKASAWRDYLIAPTFDWENLSDDEIDEQIRNTASSGAHLVGTAAMSAKNARYGVVDSDLLVKGAKGFRIIDASVLPFIPSAHITSRHSRPASYTIAERGADRVKETWQ